MSHDALAVITGATGGIGGAYAKALAHRGYNLLITGRRGSQLQDLARSLHRDHGVHVEPVALDLTCKNALTGSYISQ